MVARDSFPFSVVAQVAVVVVVGRNPHPKRLGGLTVPKVNHELLHQARHAVTAWKIREPHMPFVANGR